MVKNLSISFVEARNAGACVEAYKALREMHPTASGDYRVPLTEVLDVRGIEDTMWGFAAIGERVLLVDMAAAFATHVAHLAGREEPECREAIRVARLHVRGLASGYVELGHAQLAVRRSLDRDTAGNTPRSAYRNALRASLDASQVALGANSGFWDAARTADTAVDAADDPEAERKWQYLVITVACLTGRVPEWAWEVPR